MGKVPTSKEQSGKIFMAKWTITEKLRWEENQGKVPLSSGK